MPSFQKYVQWWCTQKQKKYSCIHNKTLIPEIRQRSLVSISKLLLPSQRWVHRVLTIFNCQLNNNTKSTIIYQLSYRSWLSFSQGIYGFLLYNQNSVGIVSIRHTTLAQIFLNMGQCHLVDFDRIIKWCSLCSFIKIC